jgi:hypothetical protein
LEQCDKKKKKKFTFATTTKNVTISARSATPTFRTSTTAGKSLWTIDTRRGIILVRTVLMFRTKFTLQSFALFIHVGARNARQTRCLGIIVLIRANGTKQAGSRAVTGTTVQTSRTIFATTTGHIAVPTRFTSLAFGTSRGGHPSLGATDAKSGIHVKGTVLIL